MKYPLSRIAKVAKRYSPKHPGVALMVDPGLPVFACGNGIVVASFCHPAFFGEYIRIHNLDGYLTSYAFMQRGSRQFFRGDRVSEGDIIGLTGQTGLAGYSQLYFEVAVDNALINPERFFEVIVKYALPEGTHEISEPEYLLHTVRKKETLTGISRVYGVTLKALKDLNDIDRAADIWEGEILKIRKIEGR